MIMAIRWSIPEYIDNEGFWKKGRTPKEYLVDGTSQGTYEKIHGMDEAKKSWKPSELEDWDLLHEDLEQIDDLDIEEMDINWQIAMIAIRMKKFYKTIFFGGKEGSLDEKHLMVLTKRKLNSSITPTQVTLLGIVIIKGDTL
ncbi:hypothetical protein Tco_0839888 [Tanacetum coccineum]|uniref:Uncharacterized protein n=1 Tax=Tanacetum coccineum TaxID=301880 RepID=A0ABQ5AT37_9ASTR